MKLINESQVFETWAPMLKEQTGITDRKKLQWMSKYCHYHALNENFSYPAAGLTNTPGMGNVTPASTAAGGASLFYSNATTGSGDKFPSLLPLSIQVAARTVGFDIVSVIPMPGPAGVLTYLDYVYAGGKDEYSRTRALAKDGSPLNRYTDIPLAFKVKLDTTNMKNPMTVGTEYYIGPRGLQYVDGSVGEGPVVKVVYVGKSRVDGSAIFRAVAVGRLVDTDSGSSVTYAFQPDANLVLGDVMNGSADTDIYEASAVEAVGATAGDAVAKVNELGRNTAELVKALEDHIQGFTGSGATDEDPWSANAISGKVPYEPMRRGVGEEQYYRTMGLQPFTKFVEAGTLQVAATVTTEQIQDLSRQYGIDVISMIENALINEISQSINKHILSRAFALGWSNHVEFYEATGGNLNLNLDASVPGNTMVSYIGKDNKLISMPVNEAANYSVGSASSFENQVTLHRRIYSKVLAAGNLIAQRGRRGPANFIVTNLQLATALQQVATQVTPISPSGSISQTNGSLYPVAVISGMTLYVDPNMEYNDNRILVGRKGADEEPGLKFMPYLMAESIQTIAEGTMAPKIAVKSRYALVEAGHHPQTQYLTIHVTVPAGGLV